MNVSDPYFLYMAEEEGLTDLVDTREAKINKLINYLRMMKDCGGDPQDYWIQGCRLVGLDPTSLTAAEQNKINKRVFR